ncbi:MAG: baseplate J/gp47 family protein [Oscillospiraceae bacterium]|jgi:uncharacterized phage protein gp47/JayE|nr:baseplate J/gp47 family protein [Oscillospiraceae bacterium]
MSYSEILEIMQNRYCELTGDMPDNAADIGIRMKVLAEQLYGLYSKAQELEEQMFPQTAAGESLERHAFEKSIARKPAAPSSGILKFSRESEAVVSIVIPKGTLCQTAEINSLRFETAEEAVLSQNETSVLVPARAVEGGAKSNVGPNMIKFFVNVIPGLSAVTNPAAFTGGVDGESDESLRGRLVDSYRNMPNGANTAFYYQLAMEEGGVYSAKVIPRSSGRGTVKVYLAAQGGQVSEELAAWVQEKIDLEKEIAVDAEVALADLNPQPVEIAIMPEDSKSYSRIAQLIDEKIHEFFNGMKIGEPLLLMDLYGFLYPTEGLKNYHVNLPLNDVPAAENELIVLGSLDISLIGGGS